MSDFKELSDIEVEPIDDEAWDLSEDAPNSPWPDDETPISNEERIKRND